MHRSIALSCAALSIGLLLPGTANSGTGNQHALTYASYLGGTQGNKSPLTVFDRVVEDDDGNFYATGYSRAKGIATEGAPQDKPAGEKDPILAKFNRQGRLLWATYWGSYEGDYGNDVAVDNDGNVYITGWTFATFPTTPGALAGTCDDEEQNSYVAKFSPKGEVIYSTCVDVERSYAIEVDDAGSAYIAGDSTYPPYVNNTQIGPVSAIDDYQAFVIKLTPDGSAVERSTSIGGNGVQGVSSIVLDDAGAVYGVGNTTAEDWPVTENAADDELTGNSDAVAFKLDPSGQELEYSTYIGERYRQDGVDIDVAPDGIMYVTGLTDSHRESMWIYGIDTDGDFTIALERAGDENLSPSSLDYTPQGTLLIAGGSDSHGLWATDPIQSKKAADFDGFVVEYDPATMAELFSSYLGGTDDDFLSDAIATDGGRMVLVGSSRSVDMPTLDAHQPQLVGKADGYFAIVSPTDTRCTMKGSPIRNHITGTVRADVICGGGGGDTLFGSDLNDDLIGGPGPDRMFGGAGSDRLIGGAGLDTGRGGPGDDRCDVEKPHRCES